MKGTTATAERKQQPPGNVTPVSGKAAFARPALITAALGVLVAAALVWVALPGPSQQAWRWQLASALGASQAASLRQGMQQISADTQAQAADPALLASLQSSDSARLRNAEGALHYRDGLVDAHLTVAGHGTPDDSRPAPISYATLDQLRQAEAGAPVPLEARQVGERWLLYSVAAVRTSDNRVAGTLLMAYDLQRLQRSLPPLPAGGGQVRLQQQFPGTAPTVLLQAGDSPAGPTTEYDLGNPNWKLQFTAGSAFVAPLPWLSILLMLVAAGVALVAFWAALSMALQGLRGLLREDAEHLAQLIEELSAGKTIKAFSLRLAELNELALGLARFSVRESDGESAPPAANEPSGNTGSDATGAPPPGSGANPAFKASEILVVEITDGDQDTLRMEYPPAMNSIAQVAPSLPASIFRAYDIRGIVGDTLTAETAYWIGRAIGSQSIAQGERHVSVGRDGRLSGPELVAQLIQGVADSGCDVSDVGMVPTGALYYAANVLKGKSGVMLTGSHNPSNYNGFKIIIAGDTLANEQIQELYRRITENDLSSGKGTIEKVDILTQYYDRIKNDIPLARKLKVVVDCGNGVGGVIAPRLIEALGCEVIPLFCDVDGNFPNHHPDPGKLENLEDLIKTVKAEGADLGLAFDGDADRVGVVTNKGNVVFPDRLLMLLAKDVISRNPGADIIFDVKCSRRLAPLISGWGGRPVMWKTGHSLIKKKIRESGALLAGEMSGHIFFKERWYGFDDGVYAAARVLEILSREEGDAEDLFATFPNDVSTPEINIQVTEESKFAIIEALQNDAQWGKANLITIDGVRVDYPKGWGLVRASNTTPVLVLRFEADDEAELERIKQVFRSQLKAVSPDIQIPF
ncbi:phosphomannomutase/phosphoglucomutase [Pseudomonas sp. C2L11]|uniref:phosphomannomutase n=2 Tax=Pseudomonas typographi TaxID=2715964 RepID=A0ABR7YZ33_9PSED|nr:phosphomannomutase/phosphoglucomutase [Pseudomonas typographi]MBD1598439.1 phosphomannomutase/phosphoglucomutase [Pseudomonas typographi]